MSYTKQNFKSGDKLYASQLNAMDEQIVANELALAEKQPKGDYLTEHQQLKTINGQSLVGEGDITIEGGSDDFTEYDDATARARFIRAMKDKADKLGMTIELEGAAGYPDSNYSTGKSMAKLYTIANGYDELAKIWHTPYKALYTKDVESVIDLYSSVFYTDSSHFASDLTDHYFMFGGKTGTTGAQNRLLGCIMEAPDGRQFAAWLSTKVMAESAGASRHSCMKLLMDIAYAKYDDPDADISSIEAQMVNMGVISAVVMLVPQTTNLLNYEYFNFHEKVMTESDDTIDSLDDIAWGGKTYREIFLTNNEVATGNMITDDTNTNWSEYTGCAMPTKTTSHFNSSPSAWDCSGTKTVQMWMTLATPDVGDKYYAACKRKVTAYNAGTWCGVQLYSEDANNIFRTKVDNTSVGNQFVTASGYGEFTSEHAKGTSLTFWVGDGGSANLTAYVDDIVCINLTNVFGSKVPSQAEMDKLYDNFLALYKGDSVAVITETYKHPYPVYEYKADDRINIASNTKTLTAITALDYIDNLDEYLTIKSTDIKPGSGPVFKGGERITIRDALYALMLPSSNTCAYAIARVIGNKLLNIYRN